MQKPTFIPGKANIVAGVPQLHIEWRNPVRERLVLPNGVYVPIGERPDHESLQRIGQLFGGHEFAERVIPADQSTEGVLLGSMMDYGISPVTAKDVNSEHVNNCHILAAVGVATQGATPLQEHALFAHINPAAHKLQTRNFHTLLRERVRQLCSSTHRFTRDVLFAGGCIDVSSEQRADWSTELCIQSIETMAKLCEELDVEPTVTRPGIQDVDTHMSLATQQRKLLVRPSFAPKLELPDQVAPHLFLASQARMYIQRIRSIMQWD